MNQRDFIKSLGDTFLKFWDHWSALPREGYIPHLSDYLDHADPELQPYVAMMDILSPTAMRVRHMGTVVTDVLGEKTGSDAKYYAEDIRAKAAGMAWRAANHPCGYSVVRVLQSDSGLLIEATGLVAPVITDTPDCLTLISFNGVEGRHLGVARDEHIAGVKTIGDPRWLDIGAGVPSS